MTTSYVPVGFRFRPTDEELVNHYLKNKLLGNDSVVNNVIAEVDVCKFEPWDLPALSVIKSDDPEWFFLCPRDFKYTKSKRLNRATQIGFWKATGNDRLIKVRGSDKVIGTKKTLVYYKSGVPSVRTNWVIHEYHDANFDESQRTFVLCRLIKKVDRKVEEETEAMICDEGEPSRNISPAADYENEDNVDGIPDVSCSSREMNMESIFQAPNSADKYFPFLTQQSLIYENELDISLSNSWPHDAYSRDENIDIQSLFETPEEEVNFVNSMFIDGDFVTLGKNKTCFLK